MVDHIKAAGHLHSRGVEQALRTVPRHLFLPEASARPSPPSSAAATAGRRAVLSSPARHYRLMISPSEWKTGTVGQPGPQRPSWCYSTPGLARAQQLAALALGDPPRQRRAENALAGCIADEEQLSQLGDLSLCHGWAGLVHTTRRAAAEAGTDSELAALLPYLYTRFEQHLHEQRPPTCDGLLEGAAGIALTRHTTAAPAFRWDACLLISPPTPENTHMEGMG